MSGLVDVFVLCVRLLSMVWFLLSVLWLILIGVVLVNGVGMVGLLSIVMLMLVSVVCMILSVLGLLFLGGSVLMRLVCVR